MVGKITLVTGGAKSGKSAFAEKMLESAPSVCYIATSTIHPNDEEMKRRVANHVKQRKSSWETEERFKDIASFLEKNDKYSSYLLDCATFLSTNLFYDKMVNLHGPDYDLIDQRVSDLSEKEKLVFEGTILKEWESIVQSAKRIPGNLVVVTNEVGLGIVPENPFTRWFRDVFGRVNQYLASESDEVFMVVSGIPMEIKK